MTPELTIVIPTYDRRDLLRTAVESALGQDVEVEVIVVDDGSPEPVALAGDPRLRILRNERSQGGSAARNRGAREALAPWVMWLDDDDELLPHAGRTSLEAIRDSDLPAPVAALSGIEVIDDAGQVVAQRLPPPALPRGSHFALEGPVDGRSYSTKQTLVVDRELVLGLGGFDPAFRSRVHTELFLRLNPACSLVGVPVVTYRWRRHSGQRVSSDPALRQHSFAQLVAKHRQAFESHPAGYATFLLGHALISWNQGRRWAAGRAVARAARVAPRETARWATRRAVPRAARPRSLWRRASRFSFGRRRISRRSTARLCSEVATDERTLVVHSRDVEHSRFFPNSVVLSKGRDAEADPRAVPYLQELREIADESFPVVLCTGLLEHVSDPALLIAELHRILVPGGRLIVTGSAVFSFHGRPYNFFHFTTGGFRLLFDDWSRFQVLRGSTAPFETIAILLERILIQCAVFPPARPVIELTSRILPRLDALVLRQYDGVDHRSEQARTDAIMPAAMHAVVVK